MNVTFPAYIMLHHALRNFSQPSSVKTHYREISDVETISIMSHAVIYSEAALYKSETF